VRRRLTFDGFAAARWRRLCRGGALGLAAAAVSHAAAGYGPQGHLIAGRVAEPLLCDRAAAAVAELTGNEDLGEVGLWADRIRSDPSYADSAPWHYMNIADDARIDNFTHPPEGDVLWAIRYFSGRLSARDLDLAEHTEALRFLVHFIVDIHQPLHVGLAEDRGGNAIGLEFQGEATNLHRFWDTHAIESAGLSVPAYVSSVVEEFAVLGSAISLDPVAWAQESQRLRQQVYGFGRAGREPAQAYTDLAARVTRDRLGMAALRLAGTLNEIFCG